jgi:hypothetical protein
MPALLADHCCPGCGLPLHTGCGYLSPGVYKLQDSYTCVCCFKASKPRSYDHGMFKSCNLDGFDGVPVHRVPFKEVPAHLVQIKGIHAEA